MLIHNFLKTTNNWQESKIMIETVEMTSESIKGFGVMLSTSDLPATWDTDDFKFTPDVFTFNYRPQLTAGILVGKKRDFKLDLMERHSATSEILVQLQNNGILFLAKPEWDAPSTEVVTPFLLRQGTAVALLSGTWHWVPYPVDENCTTLILFSEGTLDNDQLIQEVN